MKIEVEGLGTVVIKTVQGDIKLFHNIKYMPSLARNLMSVGQLMTIKYANVFDDDACGKKFIWLKIARFL